MILIAYSRVAEDELRTLEILLDLAKINGYSLIDVSNYEDYTSLKGKPLIVIGASLAKKVSKDVENGFGVIDKPSKAIQEAGFHGFWQVLKGFLPRSEVAIIENSPEILEATKQPLSIPPGKTVKILSQNSQIVIHPSSNFARTSPFDISLEEFNIMRDFVSSIEGVKWIMI